MPSPAPLRLRFWFQGERVVKNISSLSSFSPFFARRSDPRKDSFTREHLRDSPTRLLAYLCLVSILLFLAAVRVTLRDERCVMVNFDLDTSERDSNVMKTVVSLNENCVGGYATVVRAGELRVGQVVTLGG